MIGLRTVQGSFRVAIDDVEIKQAKDQPPRTEQAISIPQLRSHLPTSSHRNLRLVHSDSPDTVGALTTVAALKAGRDDRAMAR